MIVVLILLFGVILGLLALFLGARSAYYRERNSRLAIHRARVLDNDQRSVDNERWAERVQQARKLGQDQIDILEHRRLAGSHGEGAPEHIRNALGILINAPSSPHEVNVPDVRGLCLYDTPVVLLERADFVAIKERLWTAVNMLEGRSR